MALILSFAVFGVGQKQKQQPDSADNAKPTKERGATIESGSKIEGQLQSTIDVKKAKVGDEVVLRTTKTIKQNGQTVIPKGSRLLGRVTEVQQKTKSNGESKLGLVFDRLEGKDLSMPINASIVSITNVMSNTRVGDSAETDLFGSSSSSTRTSGGSSGGGSLLGGVTSTVGGVANTGGLLNTTTQTVGSVTNTAGQTLGSTVGSVTRTVNGIQISNAVDGSVQSGSTLSTSNKNIKLEKGVMIGLQMNSSVRSN